MNEKQLIAKYIKNDEMAMRMFFDKHTEALKTISLRSIKDQNEAKEAFQEGPVERFHCLHQIRTSFYSLSNKTKINKALMPRHKTKWTYQPELFSEFTELSEGKNSPVSVEDNREALEVAEIRNLLPHLPVKYRILINLYAALDLKPTEKRGKSGISVALSKKTVSRFRIKLVELINIKNYETT